MDLSFYIAEAKRLYDLIEGGRKYDHKPNPVLVPETESYYGFLTTTGYFIPDANASKVDRMFKLALERRSPAQIAEIMNLSPELVESVLTDPVYKGAYRGKEGHHAGYIKPDKWEEVQFITRELGMLDKMTAKKEKKKKPVKHRRKAS